MSTQQGSFSFPSFRRLRQYLGEADALVEVAELAARYFIANAHASGDVNKFIEAASSTFGIRVNLAEVTQLHTHLYRHYIVNVYQSAERFLHEFRQEHVALHGLDWIGDAHNIDPLSVTLKNIGESEASSLNAVGRDLVTRFQYYRIIRNWVVHTKDAEESTLLSRFAEIEPYSRDNQVEYSKISGPSKPDLLNFDDFILFSRLTKHIAHRICEVAMPTENKWLMAFQKDSKRFMRLKKNPDRMINAIAGRLRTEYGMDNANSLWIAQEIHKQL